MKLKKLVKALFTLSLIIISIVLAIDLYVQWQGSKYIVNPKESVQADAILVLGAAVYPNERLSPMLQDRLLTALNLYQKGKSQRIIVSGDHGTDYYDEVNAMKNFLIEKGVSSKNIFMDHAGFSTYESMYRARDIFKAEKVIIVTQGYHLKRAIYVARNLGIEAIGVASDLHNYGSVMQKYKLREIAARNKDFILSIVKPKPTFLGDPIPVTGDGGLTDDKK